jgi:hypothetical protein
MSEVVRLSREHVAAELVALDLLYGGLREPEEIEIMAAAWWRDLRDLSDAEFSECVSAARQQSRFFPTTAAVREAWRERGRRLPKAKALPPGRAAPPEKARKHAANITAFLANRPLPHPEVAPEKWRRWTPEDRPPVDGCGCAVRLGGIAPLLPGADGGRTAAEGSMHDPRPRRGEPPAPEAGDDWDHYARMANG